MKKILSLILAMSMITGNAFAIADDSNTNIALTPAAIEAPPKNKITASSKEAQAYLDSLNKNRSSIAISPYIDLATISFLTQPTITKMHSAFDDKNLTAEDRDNVKLLTASTLSLLAGKIQLQKTQRGVYKTYIETFFNALLNGMVTRLHEKYAATRLSTTIETQHDLSTRQGRMAAMNYLMKEDAAIAADVFVLGEIEKTLNENARYDESQAAQLVMGALGIEGFDVAYMAFTFGAGGHADTLTYALALLGFGAVGSAAFIFNTSKAIKTKYKAAIEAKKFRTGELLDGNRVKSCINALTKFQ